MAVRCQFLLRGVGDTYLVEAGRDRYILRVYRSSHRNRTQIDMEVNLLLALRQADVPVSYPIPDHAGRLIQPLEAMEGLASSCIVQLCPRAFCGDAE